MEFKGVITAEETFFYPDTTCKALPETLRLASAQNGLRGVQLLLQSGEENVTISLKTDAFLVELFELRAIPVEYNTGNGVAQGGAMVLLAEEKPDYATRKAPFTVYDCLVPQQEGVIPVNEGVAACYFCLRPKQNLEAGTYQVLLQASGAQDTYCCRLEVTVYPVMIPADTFAVTNWFSLAAISRFHGVEQGSAAFLTVLERYIHAMRRAHQTMFFIQLDETCVTSRAPYEFDFEYLTPVVTLFFAQGMQQMEIGTLLSRGWLADHRPDMRTDVFRCAMAQDVPFESAEGYAISVRFVQALAAYLTRHGWQDKVVFHIHDEPDIHVKDENTMAHRRRQYYLAANILRKYLPSIRIIEAVDSAQFYGGVDICVPGTAGYEAKKEQFDALIALGETVWAYVCCGPEGQWLNRFLDFALLKGRLLFWGCAKNRLGGFLHWGFNQFVETMDPFVGTSCPNTTGIGTSFPCGDAFIVYPGKDGPWLSMRLEASRRGAEDAALLQLLREQNPAKHDALVTRVFRTNTDYNDNPAEFETVWEELLQALCEKSTGGTN
ncbi:MAG: DUF4091 domain-containing protein [Angelakisella sp.]